MNDPLVELFDKVARGWHIIVHILGEVSYCGDAACAWGARVGIRFATATSIGTRVRSVRCVAVFDGRIIEATVVSAVIPAVIPAQVVARTREAVAP